MALIKCKECNKEISDKATTCIHCGCPIEKEIEIYDFIKDKLEKNKYFKSKTLLECQKELSIAPDEIKTIIEKIIQEHEDDEKKQKKEAQLMEYALNQIEASIPKCPTCGSTISEELLNEILLKEDKKRREEEIRQSRMKAQTTVAARELEQQNEIAKCPTCNSTDIEKISMVGKITSVSVFGLASNNIGKTFKCNKCGYKW